jgi:hypothetical protein
MTEPSNEGAKSGTNSDGSNARSAADEVRQAFGGLPLDQKISTLIQVELDMLGDAVESVVSVVSKAVNDVAKAWESSEQSASATPGAGDQGSTS